MLAPNLPRIALTDSSAVVRVPIAVVAESAVLMSSPTALWPVWAAASPPASATARAEPVVNLSDAPARPSRKAVS
ncbi:hypothetical protein D3C78_1807510 [compost metagenome]